MKVISPTMSVIHGSTLSVMSNYVHSQVKGKKMAKIKYNYTNYVHSPKSGHSIIKAIRDCIHLTLPLKIKNTKTYKKC